LPHIESIPIAHKTSLSLPTPPGGGAVVRLSPRSNTLYACVLQDPARILYLCNTASPLDATTSIPTHLSQRMSKTTTTSFFSWRGAFQIALAVAAFLMVDPYIRKLLSFVQEHCIAELSPHWFGAFVCLLVVCCCYILPRRYKRTYIPVQLRWGLLLLAAAYLYYRLSPRCYYRLSPGVYFFSRNRPFEKTTAAM